MTVEKLERVMWRLRSHKVHTEPYLHPPGVITNNELKIAIMMEIGTDPRTYTASRRALIKLKWIISYGRTKVRLTNNDMTGG